MDGQPKSFSSQHASPSTGASCEPQDIANKANEALQMAKETAQEVGTRAKEAVKKLNKVKHEAVAAAAVRAVLRMRSPKATKVLLGFLPLAGDDKVADDIRARRSAHGTVLS